MKVLLIKPYNLSDHIQPPLGLGYLATACRHKHDVKIIDCIKDDLTADKLLYKIQKLKPNLVGFQCYTFDLKFIKKALVGCKNLDESIIAVIGGPHPSAVPRDCFKYFGNYLDYLFIGEAEKGLPLLLDNLENRSSLNFFKIPGLAWRENGNIHINAQIFTEDLDSLGMPAWELMRPEEYPECQHGAFFKNFPIAPIMVTRGCPYSCAFCAGNIVGGKKIRKHSVNFILGQIQYLYDNHNIREFHIVDDNFTFDKDYAKELLKKLIALNLDISWATPNGVRIDTLDEDLLKLMKDSGLYLISLGIESGSDNILSLMRKNITTKRITEAVRLIHKFGIEIAGFFIIGYPGESEEDIKRTIRFSLGLGLVRSNYFTYLPFPGTHSYNELVLNGEIDRVDWDNFYFMSASYVSKDFSRKQIKYFQRLAFLKFYLRPEIIIKNILDIKSFRHLKFLLKRLFHWIIMS